MRIALHTGEQAGAARLVRARLTSAKLAAMLYLDLPQLKCICIPLKFIHGAPLLEICGSHFMYKTKFSMNKIVSLDQQFANQLCRHQLNFGDWCMFFDFYHMNIKSQLLLNYRGAASCRPSPTP